MKMFICSLLFMFTIVVRSVQSENRPPLKQLLTYCVDPYAKTGIWYLIESESRVPYGATFRGTIFKFSTGLCQQQCRRRRLRVKGLRLPFPQPRLPNFHKGDIMYRDGVAVGIVGSWKNIYDIHRGEPHGISPINGDTLVLSEGRRTVGTSALPPTVDD